MGRDLERLRRRRDKRQGLLVNFYGVGSVHLSVGSTEQLVLSPESAGAYHTHFLCASMRLHAPVRSNLSRNLHDVPDLPQCRSEDQSSIEWDVLPHVKRIIKCLVEAGTVSGPAGRPALHHSLQSYSVVEFWNHKSNPIDYYC
jgi:hypothetical protein